MIRTTIYFTDGTEETYETEEGLSFDGVGSMWLQLPSGDQITFLERNVKKYTTSENLAARGLTEAIAALATSAEIE